MKRLFVLMAVFAVAALISLSASAQLPPGGSSLYEQEGTGADGYSGINAAGVYTGAGDGSKVNWHWNDPASGGSWTGIYLSGGWREISNTGDMALDIECDIEMFYTETISGNKIYFHIGDPSTLLPQDKIAYVQGTMAYNNGMYVGISFEGTEKSIANLETGGPTGFTGQINDAMVLTKDVLGRVPGSLSGNIAPASFPVKILLSWGTGYQPPISYGEGASGTIIETLWWLVAGGAPGAYNYTWKIELMPSTYQPDGNYRFDPIFVAAPEL